MKRILRKTVWAVALCCVLFSLFSSKAMAAKPENDAVIQAMPIKTTSYATVSLTSIFPPGTADFVVKVKASIDAGNARVISVDSVDVYQQGHSFNYDSCTVTGLTYSKNTPSYGQVQVSFTLSAVFTYNDPIGQATVGNTIVKDFTVNVNCR